jgi:hypothetical protein
MMINSQIGPSQTGQQAIRAVLQRRRPDRIVYAPNYWQWLAHQQNHATLPREIVGCQDQLQLIEHMGLDVFSRNIYCDQQRLWFGGLSDTEWDGVQAEQHEYQEGNDLVIQRDYATPAGTLSERQRYDHAQSTLVQEKFLVDDYVSQLDCYERLVLGRRWRFFPERYRRHQQRVGDAGLVMAGELSLGRRTPRTC